mgnify:CR=1 FL=1
MGKKDEKENGVFDTIGEAFSTAGEFISDKLSGGRYTKEGLEKIREKAEKEKEEKKKEKPKKVTGKPKPKPQRVSERTQRAESPNGAQFNTFTETDKRTKEMKVGPITPINVQSSIDRLNELRRKLKND